jgi:Flp pilus assembly CpaE family ATPase
VIAVVAADHVGIGRFAAAWPNLQELASERPLHVLVNRVRSRAVGRDVVGQIDEALRRLCGVTATVLVDDDPELCDLAIRDGRTIAELAPRSALRVAFASLADRLALAEAPQRAVRESAA